MYLYYDSTLTLKEIINDKALRQGNYGVNSIYVHIDGLVPASIDVRYLVPGGAVITPSTPYSEVVSAQIPFDKKRDLYFFRYFENYDFIKIDLTLPLGGQGPLDVPGLVTASMQAIMENGDQQSLGDLNFIVEESGALNVPNRVAQQEWLALADYEYVRKIVGDTYTKEEANERFFVNGGSDLQCGQLLAVHSGSPILNIRQLIEYANIGIGIKKRVIAGNTMNGIADLFRAAFDNYKITYAPFGSEDLYTIEGNVADIGSYGFGGPEWTKIDVLRSTDVTDIADSPMPVSASAVKAFRDTVAEEYDPYRNYELGDWCYHEGDFYYCNTNSYSAGEWDASEWQNATIEPIVRGKQNALTFDSAPQSGSPNPVTSDGIYRAIAESASTIYRFLGTATCSQVSALTEPANGDVWAVSDTGTITWTGGSLSVTAGDSVAWNGTAWAKLPGSVDLSGYATTSALNDAIDGCVALTGNQSVAGDKTFTGAVRFSGDAIYGSSASYVLPSSNGTLALKSDISDATVNFRKGGSVFKYITLNQGANVNVDIPIGTGVTTLKVNGVTQGTIGADDSSNQTINVNGLLPSVEVVPSTTIAQAFSQVPDVGKPFVVSLGEDSATVLCKVDDTASVSGYLRFIDLKTGKTYSVNRTFIGDSTTCESIFVNHSGTLSDGWTNYVTNGDESLLTSKGAYGFVDGTYKAKKAEQTDFTLASWNTVNFDGTTFSTGTIASWPSTDVEVRITISSDGLAYGPIVKTAVITNSSTQRTHVWLGAETIADVGQVELNAIFTNASCVLFVRQVPAGIWTTLQGASALLGTNVAATLEWRALR